MPVTPAFVRAADIEAETPISGPMKETGMPLVCMMPFPTEPGFYGMVCDDVAMVVAVRDIGDRLIVKAIDGHLYRQDELDGAKFSLRLNLVAENFQ